MEGGVDDASIWVRAGQEQWFLVSDFTGLRPWWFWCVFLHKCLFLSLMLRKFGVLGVVYEQHLLGFLG